ncbi:MAG: glycosyltransferase family 2 protein [Verrucomicrobia bacterium]|nr:glycosyltransferase family 2 protein [Verrucomicrobiota bacterium]
MAGTSSRLITVIPVFNGEAFIAETLESVARQTRRPDRVIVIDNCSTDRTESVVKGNTMLPCEWQRNPSNLGLFGNCNRALEFAAQTDYLHILHADDLIEPAFYETLAGALEDCAGRGLAWCLDRRIDQHGRAFSVSGRPTGALEVVPRDRFLAEKAAIGNQAFSGTLLKTHRQPAPCSFRLDMPILADMVFWPDWGRHCEKIVRVHAPLSKYRWHGDNTTTAMVPGLQALVLDEWRVMELVESYRDTPPSLLRRAKLRGLFAVRSGIKAKRFRQRGNPRYAAAIAAAARPVSGAWLWGLAQGLVHARDLVVYGLLRRRKHPNNVYS